MPDGVGAVGRDGLHGDAVRQQVVQDREVVGSQVPQHVDVGLHETEVDPYGVDELDVAERPAADHPRSSWTAEV